MNRNYRHVFLALAAAFAFCSAGAQGFPTKPVRLLVPYAPGGPADVLARAMAPKLSEMWGQPVLVENKPGANEIVAADLLVKSPADGHTLLLASEATFTLNPELQAKLPYNPSKDFAPVSRLVTANLMIAGRPDLPAQTVPELIAYLKTHKSTYASTGMGGTIHLAMSWFNTLSDIKADHVTYNGLPLALQDVMASRVDLIAAIPGGLMPHVNAGKLKVFGISGESRLPKAAQVPTFAEQGMPQFEASVYFALTAPAGTPRAATEKIAADTARVMASPDLGAKVLDVFGFLPVQETPAQFVEFLKKDRELGARRVKAAGLRMN